MTFYLSYQDFLIQYIDQMLLIKMALSKTEQVLSLSLNHDHPKILTDIKRKETEVNDCSSYMKQILIYLKNVYLCQNILIL